MIGGRDRETPRREPAHAQVPVTGVVGVGRSTRTLEFVARGSDDLGCETALSGAAC